MKKNPPALLSRVSSKSQKNTPARRKSPRDLESQNPQISPTIPTKASEQSWPSAMAGENTETTTQKSSDRDDDTEEDRPGAEKSDSSEQVVQLRKKMVEGIAHRQVKKGSVVTPPLLSISSGRRQSQDGTPQSLPNHMGSSDFQESIAPPSSTESTKTVKGVFTTSPAPVCTPSYPFPRMTHPRMTLRLNRGSSHLSAASHKPFTLLSPTNTPDSSGKIPLSSSGELASSEMSTPGPERGAKNQIVDDPNFPSPDLYDLLLMINAEPGLDAWWANVTQILAEAYGAERASLAIPGDFTDLENVPWGQKATFNISGYDSSFGSSKIDSIASEVDQPLIYRTPTTSTIRQEDPISRPSLTSRHSIAGALPEAAQRGSRPRPMGPQRAVSTMIGTESAAVADNNAYASRQSLPRRPSAISDHRPQNSDNGSSQPPIANVYPNAKALENEKEPLLLRTAVSSLFGRRKPFILTRAFSGDAPASDLPSSRSGFKTRQAEPEPNNKPDAERPGTGSRRGSTQSQSASYEEFEQPEPSPWSQSPAPSPAARPDPSESPFFAAPASIDEMAFAKDPPNYDYATTANQSLEAIGADTSKTLVHIPLIQPIPARGYLSSNLRFPIAILSFMSPITPYPRTFRHSLTQFLPHLANSYSLAQQYSVLQDRIRGTSAGHLGTTFGLGGTFSDESSELELMAELSGQVSTQIARGSVHGSMRSASGSLASRSPPSSSAGTPYLDNFGVSPGVPSTPGRGADMVDSYFSAKRHRTSAQPHTPSGQNVPEETPEKLWQSRRKEATTGSSGVKKSASVLRRQNDVGLSSLLYLDTLLEHHTDSAGNQKDQSNRQTSAATIQDKRSGPERALPDLISQLMLNSVPLQLFLAKPKDGELVWTNSKFDAYRAQGEGRVKDPWQNTHPKDRDTLAKGWQGTLKYGSQFTQSVRVRRFNSDSDYRWFIFRASTLLSQSGRLLYWIGSFLDVHDQHVAKLKADQEKENFVRDAKYRALANSIPQILFEAVENIGIVSANEQWHTFSGQSLDDALNLGFAKHVHRDDLRKCGLTASTDLRNLAVTIDTSRSVSGSSESSGATARPDVVDTAAMDRRSPASLSGLIQKGIIKVECDENGRFSYSTEIRLRSRGGEFRYFLVRLVKVESDLLNSGKASWYGTCTDINDRKSLERELNRVNKKIQAEMEGKTKFFANMSHEIRTPLNGILGSIPWLVESSLDHDQRRTVDTIQNSSNNLRELVDNILDVTKVEAGKMTLVHKWFHIRTLVEEIIDTLGSRAIDRGLELNYSVDFDVPAVVKGDPFRVRQVVLNLMGNAVKFTEQGEVYAHCSIRKHDENPVANTMLIAFDIVDTGRGVSESEFQRLFKQFGQIEGSSNHDAGSGLGLFLSKQLVEMHGGLLSAKSKVNHGSTFSFYIRVEVGSVEDHSTSPRPAAKRSSVSDLGQMSARPSSKTSTAPTPKSSIVQSPGLSRYVSSPEAQSPLPSTGSSQPSIGSLNETTTSRSSMSSVHYPETEPSSVGVLPAVNERQVLVEKAMATSPQLRRSMSENESLVANVPLGAAHPTIYSIILICPAVHARAAIKQHIEQVVPHGIAVNVTTVASTADFLALKNGSSPPTFTHIVLNLPASADVMLFMRQMTAYKISTTPALVIITDLYQKRDIQEDFTKMTRDGGRAYLIHKPVKPSVFALIFDPTQLRNLSKDRTREVAQSVSEDFKNVSEKVKKAIGGRSFRVLLVEDSDVNRMVSLMMVVAYVLANPV